MNAQTPSQSGDFTSMNSSVSDALRSYARQINYILILPRGKDKHLDQRVSLHMKERPIDSVLRTLTEPYSLAYTIQPVINTITITVRSNKPAPSIIHNSTPFLTIRGEVTDENGMPVAGANIRAKSSPRTIMADSTGKFILDQVKRGEILSASSVGMDSLEKIVEGPGLLRIHLNHHASLLGEITIEVNNGYQKLSKKMGVGSYGAIDNTLINRSVSPNALDRIENLSPGVLFPHGGQSVNGSTIPAIIEVRGRSTLFANPSPLVVLDNFPYDGDLRNINPNDIDTIYILKDAAATSIWGLRAGNGVIVLTTKKGKGPVPQLTYNTSIGFQQKPDLSNIRSISSTDFLHFERQLFDSGYYASNFTDPMNHDPVTSGVALLYAKQQGLISPAAADAQLTALSQQDIRKDIGKYFYGASINQQHSLQLSGNGTGISYYFSAGWDHNLSNVIATKFDRFSLRSQNSFTVTRNLQVEAGANFTLLTDKSGNNIQYNYLSPHGAKGLYPYAKLADAQGHPLPVNLDYNSNYLQQTDQLGFPSWSFTPLSDLHAADHTTKTRDYLLTAGARYKLIPSLNLEFKYQFEDQLTSRTDLYKDSSYFARDLVNRFIQVDPNTHHLSYPIPPGGIQDVNNNEVVSNQGRLQLNYSNQQRKWHELDAIAGYEIRSMVTTGNNSRYYGYDPDRISAAPPLDYTTSYTQYGTFAASMIPNPQGTTHLTDHFISIYGNAAYTYHNLYSLFGSIRNDRANLFGVNTNGKGVPLWSTGVAWQASNQNFYPLNWLPFLKFRATYGRSGNIARLASAYTTALSSTSGGPSGSPYDQLTIQSPPNKNLRWEQVDQWNYGVDFATKGRILSGTIEYYRKNATDLLAQIPADPTLGLTQTLGTAGTYYGNAASIKGKGVDVQLDTRNLNGELKWTTRLLYSYTSSIVHQYLVQPGLGNIYLDQNVLNPVAGKPVLGVYSFRTQGLDPQTGDPRGIANGKTSLDWASLYNTTRLDSMVFNGPTEPTRFGSLRNTFSWRHFSLSFTLSYQFGHYFRVPGLSYSGLAKSWTGSNAYALRWQQPGDEKKTNVPSLRYPLDESRDKFYVYSNSLVRRSDQIRWEDISLSYELDKGQYRKLPFQDIRFYTYVSGLGTIWTANKEHIDPYYINVPRDRPRYSIGMTIHFFNLNHLP